MGDGTLTQQPIPDTFELTLRSVLRQQAAGPLPASLRSSPLHATATLPLPADGRVKPRWSWSRVVGSVATAAALATLAVGAYGWLNGGRPGQVGGWGASGSPSPSPSAPPAIVFDSGVVRLTADSIVIHAGDKVFEVIQGAGSPVYEARSDPGDADYRTLELFWTAQGVPMRLFMYFAADDDSWWVSEMRTYDGSPNGEWIYYHGRFFEAPLGLGWAGDFDERGSGDRSHGSIPGRLEVLGMRLNGFDPQTIPADVQNCQPLYEVEGIELEKIKDMVPAQADAMLRARKVCHSFRYEYPLDESSGYAERWCVAPPGRIVDVYTSDDGAVTIQVEDVVPAIHTPRPQPPVGWGC
jgi:hypothetical protein